MAVYLRNGITKPDSQLELIDAKEILILNLMPNRAETERQFTRLFATLPGNVALTFAIPGTHQVKNQPALVYQHYARWPDLRDEYFHGLIVTGAPVDQLPLAQVTYWEEYVAILKWRLTHVAKSLFTCWGAFAAGVAEEVIAATQHSYKITGVYTTNAITMPHSRYFSFPLDNAKIHVKAGTKSLGATWLFDETTHSTYLSGHLEYAADTLYQEYLRDQAKGLQPSLPENLLDAKGNPVQSWQVDAQQIFNEWLNKELTRN
ncbi:MAG: homoserine O-succinyltransferase [Lactobacillaceae bacterium]|jgi:homoserine O-succinyltransferase|nr:homoserine O-succinyltransferase [Lactobacillaceae bacterium]